MPREKRDWDPEAADAAAIIAQDELGELDPAAVKTVADWWKRHYLSAGHRRLGRMLVQQEAE